MEPMRYYFAAERTLGKLAKWLRLLGFDTIFEAQNSSDPFFKGLQSERILLTRTKAVREQYNTRQHVFIKSDHVRDQIKQVIHELGIVFQDIRPFSRCLSCNVEIIEIEKEESISNENKLYWSKVIIAGVSALIGRLLLNFVGWQMFLWMLIFMFLFPFLPNFFLMRELFDLNKKEWLKFTLKTGNGGFFFVFMLVTTICHTLIVYPNFDFLN